MRQTKYYKIADLVFSLDLPGGGLAVQVSGQC